MPDTAQKSQKSYGFIEGCRSCGSPQLEVVLDLGTSPLADRLLTKGDLGRER